MAEPITLVEAKLHLRVDISEDDSLITSLIVSARELCEAWTWRKVSTGTLIQFCDFFPANGIIIIDRPPLASVTSIEYIDTNGDISS